MSVAQKLYEGVDLENETVGLITYMRTDSVRLSDEFIASGYNFIEKDERYLSCAKHAYEFITKKCYTGCRLPITKTRRSEMHTNESAEMYLESILVLSQKHGAPRAIDVAHHTGYSKPSVSRAVGLLKNGGYVTVDGDGHLSLTQHGVFRIDLFKVSIHGCILLTEQGKETAAKILERHRVLSGFLQKLGVDEETASEDACRIEHVISDVSFEKLKDFLHANEE